MANPIYEYNLKILEHHLDTFGHVNNATYLALYEEARWDLLNTNNSGIDVIMKKRIGPVILDLHLTFKAELINREEIKIVSVARTKMKNQLVMVLDQKMLKSNGKTASTLELSVGLMDLEKRKLITPTPEWLKALGVEEYEIS
jgi:acyl-CoA thioester hydrolase